MIRNVTLIAMGTLLVAGLAGAAYAQQSSGDQATTKTGFNYEMRGGQRVEKPDSRTVAADGTVR